MMIMYANQLSALPPIGQAFQALSAFGLRYVLPSTLIVLSLVAVLLLDLWLIKLETRRWAGRDEKGPDSRSPRRASAADGSRADRPTNPGFA